MCQTLRAARRSICANGLSGRAAEDAQEDNAEVFEDSPWIFPALSESGHISEPREESVGIDWKITTPALVHHGGGIARPLTLVIKALANHACKRGRNSRYIQHEVERAAPCDGGRSASAARGCLPSDAKDGAAAARRFKGSSMSRVPGSFQRRSLPKSSNP